MGSLPTILPGHSLLSSEVEAAPGATSACTAPGTGANRRLARGVHSTGPLFQELAFQLGREAFIYSLGLPEFLSVPGILLAMGYSREQALWGQVTELQPCRGGHQASPVWELQLLP